MITHPEFTLFLSHQRHQELVAAADESRRARSVARLRNGSVSPAAGHRANAP